MNREMMQSKLFIDMNPYHINDKEKDAMRTILKSDRAAMLVKIVVDQFAELDSAAIPWLIDIFYGIINKMASNAAKDVDSMANWVNMLGRKLTIDTVKNGSRKGEPSFLTSHFRDMSEFDRWQMLVYMYHFCNFQKASFKVEAGIYSEMPTAKSYCAANKLAAVYVGGFVQLLDEMKTKPIDELISSNMFFSEYPDAKEMIEWCIQNRDKWDDFQEYVKETSKKGN